MGAGYGQRGKEASPSYLHFQPRSFELALGLADVGSILQQLRWQSDVQRVNGQIEDFHGHAFDGLREAAKEEVDPVLNFDSFLPNDQLFALVLANFGLETLDGQLGAAGWLPSWQRRPSGFAPVAR